MQGTINGIMHTSLNGKGKAYFWFLRQSICEYLKQKDRRNRLPCSELYKDHDFVWKFFNNDNGCFLVWLFLKKCQSIFLPDLILCDTRREFLVTSYEIGVLSLFCPCSENSVRKCYKMPSNQQMHGTGKLRNELM